MSIHTYKDIVNQKEFNSLAKHPLQSFEWGEARKKTGLSILRIRENDSVFTMTIHPIPYTPYSIGYIPRSVLPTKEMLTFLAEWGAENRLIFIKLEPYVKKSEENNFPLMPSLKKSPHPLFPAWTQVLDLNKSEDELLQNMKQKTRYNIRLSERKGVVVQEESNDEGFEKFSKLYFETCKRQQYHGHTPKYHRIVWDSLKNSIAKIMVAQYKDEPLASYELFLFNNRLYYPYGGSSVNHRNLMATNLLMWEAIRMGKRHGAHLFDLWGSLPPNNLEEHKWSGFSRFKEGYGTGYVEFIGSFDLVINPLLYAIYNTADTIRSTLLKIEMR